MNCSAERPSRCPTFELGCVGCDGKDSAWSQMGSCALHTVIGQNSRCRKELEPSRRLSETTGPQSPSAFRIAFRVTEGTERAARCKHEASFLTHCAPKARRYRPARESVAHVTAHESDGHVSVTAPHRACSPARHGVGDPLRSGISHRSRAATSAASLAASARDPSADSRRIASRSAGRRLCAAIG